ncbi:MAG: glycosyltransferase family 4 protein [Verrucomicrobiaceae bacterium]|nr:glycosyltransferase family 4 protein [Verrucomicrobiaceae bacterium]
MSIKPVEVSLVFRHFHPILAGAAERFRRYSAPLAIERIRYEVFTLREEEAHAENETLHETLHVRRFAAQGKPWARDAALFQRAWEHLSALRPEGHVLQTSLAHDLSTPWLNRIRSHGTGCIYVGTMVGRYDADLPVWRRWAQRWKSWRNLRPFHKVVVSTTVMARWFQNQGVDLGRIEVIPNGVDVKRFRPAAEVAEKLDLRRRLGIDATAPVVLFAGSIVPRKGIDLLLRAWPPVVDRVPDAQLVLVGGFDRPTFMTKERMQELSRFQDEMRFLAVREECRGSVTFAGESTCVEEWMRASDVFVFPTEQEGMGNVVLEAMATGLPCVITEFHGLPEKEFGKAGTEFILVPRNKESLANGLVQALSSPNMSYTMGRLGNEWVNREMRFDLTIDRYARLYRRLAGTD